MSGVNSKSTLLSYRTTIRAALLVVTGLWFGIVVGRLDSMPMSELLLALTNVSVIVAVIADELVAVTPRQTRNQPIDDNRSTHRRPAAPPNGPESTDPTVQLSSDEIRTRRSPRIPPDRNRLV
jgi:hypothetical protein